MRTRAAAWLALLLGGAAQAQVSVQPPRVFAAGFESEGPDVTVAAWLAPVAAAPLQVTAAVALPPGGEAAHDVQVSILPQGVAPLHNDCNAVAGGDGLAWRIGAMAAGEAVECTLHFSAPPAALAVPIDIVATVSPRDPDPNDNDARVVAYLASADLALDAAASDTAPDVGDTVTLTFTATNHGPDAAAGTVIVATLPDLAVADPASPSHGGSYDAATRRVTWTLDALADGASATRSVEVLAGASAAPLRADAVVSSQLHDPDPLDDAAGVTLQPRIADLRLEASVSNPAPHVGDRVAFTLALANAGAAAAGQALVSAQLPDDFALDPASISHGGVFDPATRSLHWQFGTLAPGGFETLGFEATVASGAAGTVTAQATSDTYDAAPSDNSAQATVVPKVTDLSVAVRATPAAPDVLQDIEIAVDLATAGPAAAENPVLQLLLPTGLEVQVATISHGGVYDAASHRLVWQFASVGPGAPIAPGFTGRLQPGAGAVHLHASAVSDTFDANPADNHASLALEARSTDLRLDASLSDDTPSVGQAITLVVELHNPGTWPARNVTATAQLPEGLAVDVTSLSHGGVYDASVHALAWMLGDLAPAGTWSLSVQLQVTPDAAAQSAITASAVSDTHDPAPGNNAETVVANLSP